MILFSFFSLLKKRVCLRKWDVWYPIALQGFKPLSLLYEEKSLTHVCVRLSLSFDPPRGPGSVEIGLLASPCFFPCSLPSLRDSLMALLSRGGQGKSQRYFFLTIYLAISPNFRSQLLKLDAEIYSRYYKVFHLNTIVICPVFIHTGEPVWCY